MKTTAVAHPIQGLVKYHGLVDPVRRIPYHGSISVCTAPTRTQTTVEEFDEEADRIEIDGEAAKGRAYERAVAVLDGVRALAEEEVRFRVVSESNFPKHVGLGSSASGFAALARAACDALDFPLSPGEVSELARGGAGSACRAVTGGFSEWITRGQRSYGRCLAEPGDLDWAIVALLVRHDVPTEGVHAAVKSSPHFQTRLDIIEDRLQAARDAIRTDDPVALMQIAETDTLDLHAVTMTADDALVAWRGPTLEAMHAVRSLRVEQEVPAYFSIDTGATVYVNTLPEHRKQVREALAEAVPGAELMELEVAPGAHTVDEHLF